MKLRSLLAIFLSLTSFQLSAQVLNENTSIAITLKGSLTPCTIKPCNDAGNSGNTGECTGIDISNNYAIYPNPFKFFTSPEHPGVTLPGSDRAKKCNWTVGTNFIWNGSAEACILNGAYGNIEQCSTGHDIDKALLEKWASLAQAGRTLNVTLPDGKSISAMLGFGHGVQDGICGDIALIEQGDQYVLLLQNGARAWSLEISQPANTHLASDNNGGTCYIPNVAMLDDNSAKAIEKVVMDSTE